MDLLDINAEAEKALMKTGYSIAFRYPQSIDAIPVVSFYTVSEAGEMSADNCEMFRQGVIGVDIFAQTPGECGEMAQNIHTAMIGDGWDMIVAMDIGEEKDGVFHKTMRFTKSFYVFN